MGSRPIYTFKEYQRLKEMGAKPPNNGYILQTTSGSSDDDGPPLKRKKTKGKKKKGITREFTLSAQLIIINFCSHRAHWPLYTVTDASLCMLALLYGTFLSIGDPSLGWWLSK